MNDLPYVLCDPCIARDCDNCDGYDESQPFCGHRCDDLMVVDDD